MERSFGSEGIDFARRDGGRCARSFVEPEVVAVSGWVLEMPEGLALGTIQAFDHLLIAQAMEDDEFAVEDGWPAKPLADDSLPQDSWSLWRPGAGQVMLRIDAIVAGAKKLRPVARVTPYGQGQSQRGEQQRASANAKGHGQLVNGKR